VSRGERYPGLDGLRGLAALSVFFGHALDLWREGTVPAAVVDSPLHLVWDGTAAVDLFFVLSGFVLALPFVGAGAQRPGWTRFAIRRVFRIFPAYWASLALALWFRSLYAPAGLAGLSAWIGHFWAAPLGAGELARHALLIGPSFDTSTLDPVVWSLVVEMRMSLLFPLVVWGLAGVRTWRGGTAALALSLAIALGAPRLGVHTFTFLPLFVLGAVLATLRRPLFASAARLPHPAVLAVAAAALLLYDVRFALFGFRFDYYAADLVIGVGGAALLVLAAARPGWQRALSSRPIALLGRVSYSFYLIHLPVLIVLTSWLHRAGVPAALCALAALVASLALAWLLLHAVEQPFQGWGRALARPRPTRARAPLAAAG
jgi:peptidoglycan/LPS O-acetylase OafA/YrhL